jgi:hypothetical protein
MLQACASRNKEPIGFEADFEDDAKSWREVEVQIPAYPRPENLLAVPLGGGSPHRFFVDAPSVALGPDGVTRYTVVTKTEGGATNVSYEGLRCETREHKVYAYAHADGKWVRVRNAEWKRVVLNDRVPYPHTLFNQFFCNERTRPTPARVALDALKRGIGLAPGAAIDD